MAIVNGFPTSLRAQTAWVIGLTSILLVTGLCGLFSGMRESQIQRDRSAVLAAVAHGIAVGLDHGLRARQGQPVGGPAAALDFKGLNWVHAVVEGVLAPAGDQHIDAFVVADAGPLLYATRPGADIEPAGLKSALDAAGPVGTCAGCTAGVVLRWNDGAAYLTSASELPGSSGAAHATGWRVVVRQPAELVFAQVGHSTAVAFGVGACASLAAAFTAWLAAGFLSWPMVRLSQAAKAVERGEAGATIPLLTPNKELSELTSALTSMTERLLGSRYDLEERVAQRSLELQVSNARLKQANLEQHAMLDNDMVGIMKVRDRSIVWKNRATQRMFGYAPGEMLGMSSRALFPDDEVWAQEGTRACEVMRAGGRYSTQIEMRRKNGDPIWVELNGVQLSAETGEFLILVTDISAMKAHQAQIEHIAFHDALTGLPNRLLLADRLHHALSLSERLSKCVALCAVDLDGFKLINDRHGHAAGDQVLRAVARRMKQAVRASDTVARFGGDEFVLVLSPLDGRAEAHAVLERLVEDIERPVRLEAGPRVAVSASIGVAIAPDDGGHPARLMQLADAAMYAAKGDGKHCIRYSVGLHA